ncbi:hypothetical protein ACJX0J_035501, partial [Zea mays]
LAIRERSGRSSRASLAPAAPLPLHHRSRRSEPRRHRSPACFLRRPGRPGRRARANELRAEANCRGHRGAEIRTGPPTGSWLWNTWPTPFSIVGPDTSKLLRMFLVGPGIQPWLRRGDSYLRLVESLSGLKTIAVACGSPNPVFTWGKGANGRLGHGDTGLGIIAIIVVFTINKKKELRDITLSGGIDLNNQE